MSVNTLTGIGHQVRKTVRKVSYEHEEFREAIVCKDAFRPSKRTRLVLSSHRVLGVKKKKSQPVFEAELDRISKAEVRGEGLYKELWIHTKRDQKAWPIPPDEIYDFKSSIEDEMTKPVPRNRPELSANRTLNASGQELQSRIQQFDSEHFEYFVADVWDERGWDTEVTTASGDGGVDIFASKHNPSKKQAIQAKRYGSKTSVGGPEIQQYASLQLQFPDVDEVVVVTSGSFTKAALQRAQELDVTTVDGRELSQIVEENDLTGLVSAYLED